MPGDHAAIPSACRSPRARQYRARLLAGTILPQLVAAGISIPSDGRRRFVKPRSLGKTDFGTITLNDTGFAIGVDFTSSTGDV